MSGNSAIRSALSMCYPRLCRVNFCAHCLPGLPLPVLFVSGAPWRILVSSVGCLAVAGEWDSFAIKGSSFPAQPFPATQLSSLIYNPDVPRMQFHFGKGLTSSGPHRLIYLSDLKGLLFHCYFLSLLGLSGCQISSRMSGISVYRDNILFFIDLLVFGPYPVALRIYSWLCIQ